MKTLLLLLLLSAAAFGADATLTWEDDQPGVTWNVYEKTGGSWTKIGAATTKAYTLKNVGRGRHSYAVTAQEGGVESVLSEPATMPAAVLNVRISISIEVP